jgi:hypothetical protein
MEVKGLAIIPMKEYVMHNFGPRFSEWIGGLSAESREIVQQPLASSWYPIQSALIEPTQKICDIFHNGNLQGAWQVGRYSAEHALKGIYSLFIKFGSPSFIIKRGARIITQYYNPSEIKIAENGENRVIVQIVKFENPHSLIELRIGGWMERAIELSGKNPTTRITRSMAQGHPYTEYTIEW